jgi:hypothetical protein
MNHHMHRLRLVAIGLLLLFGGAARADFESEVIDLVNAEREVQGLHPLSFSEELTLAARRHSQDMGERNFFSHTTPEPDAVEFQDRITDAGYDYRDCGENIAAGYATPAAVVAGWMNSDGHRRNILDPDYCDIGVGYATVSGSDYFHYWTQDFGRRAGVTQCPEPLVASNETEATSTGATGDTAGGGESTGGDSDSSGGCFIGSSMGSSAPLTSNGDRVR